MTNPPEYAHVATLIRLNVTTTALELAAHDMRQLVREMTVRGAREETLRDGYRETLTLIEAAIDIARGARIDVPAPLRERSTDGIMHDTAAIERFLKFGQEG